MTLLRYYESTLFLQRLTSVTAKLALFAVLYLVATGNRYPGNRLITGILIAQLIVAGLLAISAGPLPMALGLVSLAAAGVLGTLYLQPEAEYVVVPEKEATLLRALVLASFAVMFGYPFLPSLMPAGSQIVYTPMGLVPQPALGVFLVLAWQAELPRVRVVGRWIALLALAAAGIDAAGGMGTSALVIGGMGAAYLIGEFLRHTQFVDHSPRDDQDDSNEGLSRKLPRLSFLDKNGSEEAEPPRQQQRPGPGGTAKRPAGKKWDI